MLGFFPLEAVFFVFLGVLAVTITLQRDLFAAGMLTGIFSLVSEIGRASCRERV